MCFVLLVSTLAACSAKDNIDSDNYASDPADTDSIPITTQPSWHNLDKDVEGLSERERIIVDFFYTDYIRLEYSSFTDHAKIYENANISTPLVIAKIISSDEETYEAIAILVDWDDHYDFFSAIDSLKANNYSLEGRQLIHITGNQTDPYGDHLSEHEILRMYGRYNGMIEKEIEGKTYDMFSMTVNQYVEYSPSGYVDPISKYNYETVARAIFGNDIEIERAQDAPGHIGYLVVTPND